MQEGEICSMKYDLEQRLTRFSVAIVKAIDSLPQNPVTKHLSGQLMRSGTAPALLYGEAQSGESRRDFIHKMKIGLKELRETFACLKVLEEAGYLQADYRDKLLKENDELIAIFHTSITTATKNLRDFER